MKLNHLLRFIIFLFTIALTLEAFADSGKFWVGRPGANWRWPEYQTYYPPQPIESQNLPPDYYNNWQNQQNNTPQSTLPEPESSDSVEPDGDNSQDQSGDEIDQYQDPRGMVIEEFGDEDGGGDGDVDGDGDVNGNDGVGGGAGFGLFSEERQQAIIAWNGRTDEYGEEVLILTTNEQINEKIGKSAVTLNVVPLPGRPIDIQPADSKIFEKTKELLSKKYTAASLGGGFPAVMYKKVGSHEIFVWRIDKEENFKNAIMTYVKQKFKGKYVIKFTKEMEEVINSYYKRGYRYFAFDLSHVEEDNTTREAIAYHFKSRFVYFPLVISQIGGMPNTSTIVDMIVMTPGRITMKPIKTNKGKVISDNNLFVVHKQSVKFTQNEIRKLDPTLAKVLRGYPEVTVRNILLHGDLVGFHYDFIATKLK